MPTITVQIYRHTMEQIASSAGPKEHSSFGLEGTQQELLDYYFSPDNETTELGRKIRLRLQKAVYDQLPHLNWSHEENKRKGQIK